MLDKQDVEVFERLLDKRFAEQDRGQVARLKDLFDTYKKDTIAELRDEMRAQIAASENRIVKVMDARFDAVDVRMDKLHTDIVTEVCGFIDDVVLPHITRYDREIARINAHLKLADVR